MNEMKCKKKREKFHNKIFSLRFKQEVDERIKEKMLSRNAKERNKL